MSKENTITVAGTEYFAVKRSKPSRKQSRANATNKRLKAMHALACKQAAKRDAKSGLKTDVPEPEYVGAPVPLTLMRVTPKKSQWHRKKKSAKKQYDLGLRTLESYTQVLIHAVDKTYAT